MDYTPYSGKCDSRRFLADQISIIGNLMCVYASGFANVWSQIKQI